MLVISRVAWLFVCFGSTAIHVRGYKRRDFRLMSKSLDGLLDLVIGNSFTSKLASFGSLLRKTQLDCSCVSRCSNTTITASVSDSGSLVVDVSH